MIDRGTRDGWLRLADTDLLSQCSQSRFKGSGPGGQRRNKVETGVRLLHRPTGVHAQAAETRSTEENRSLALHRLRKRIALQIRSPFGPEGAGPPEFAAQRSQDGRLTVNPRNPAYPLVVATALDALAAVEESYPRAAELLGITPSQLRRLLEGDREVWRTLSDTRKEAGWTPR